MAVDNVLVPSVTRTASGLDVVEMPIMVGR